METEKQIVKEKEVVHDDWDHCDHRRRYATQGEALGIGIPALALGGIAALSLWNRGDLLGGGRGHGTPENVNIVNGGGSSVAPTSFEAWEKSCDDAIALTNEIWRMRMAGLQDSAASRERDVAEKFSLWKSQVDGDFGLYKTTRDLYDVLNERYAAKFCELDKKVYGMEIANLYQNKIIQMGLDNVFERAVNYTDRKTCKAIYGELVLPNTPEVTGFGSVSCCNRTTE